MVDSGKVVEAEAVENVATEEIAAQPGTPDDDDEVQVWVVDEDGEKNLAEDEMTATGPLVDPPADSVAEFADGSEVERLRKELAQVKEQWLRTVADLDNYRKRSEREQRESRRFALFEPMRDLLSVVDNLDRAVAAGGSVDDLKLGVEMILSQLKDYLRKQGVEEIPAVGVPFDPNLHDAVSRHEDAEVGEPTVAGELQRGYRLHERLLRPALVTVAMPPAVKKVEIVDASEAEAGEEAAS